VLVVAPDHLQVPEEKLRAALDGGRVFDPRERVEGERRLGGGDAADGGGEGDILVEGEPVRSMSTTATA
jgi:hypothetical protein